MNLLWDKFPKFVLGFIITCLFVSWVIVPKDWSKACINLCLYFSGWFEAMGFVCIGINIQFTEMIKKSKLISRLIPLYIIGQSIDLCTTGILAFYAFKN